MPSPLQMDPRAFRVAQQFVWAHLRQARYAPEFLQWAQSRRFPNPNPQGRLKDVKFDSLPDEEQRRIYDQWRGQRNVQEEPGKTRAPKPQTPQEIAARNVDLARNGKVVNKRVLSAGGGPAKGEVGQNQSYLVKLEKDGQTQIFINKPATGEEPFLRTGIPAGQYHSREQAAYTIDSLLGGRPVVPVTQTRGLEGSYQLWAQGAKQMHDKDLDDLVSKVPFEELTKNEDFQRINVLDLILGHEDRHRGNLLYSFDGDETPENLRFAAIDNGLSLSNPVGQKDRLVYTHPFSSWYIEPPDAKRPERMRLFEEGHEKGDKAVADLLSDIPEELHKKLKGVNLTEMAKAITAGGVDTEGAVRAALVRMAVLQDDPRAFQPFMKGNTLGDAWREFQYMSGQGDDLLWRSGSGEREDEINDALKAARPKGGWAKSHNLSQDQEDEELRKMRQWGDSSPDAATVRPDMQTVKHGKKDFQAMASNVKQQWYLTKFARGRSLTISQIDMRTMKPRELGSFTLGRDGQVKAKYKDSRFRNEIRRGIRVLGRSFAPDDGAAFMAALEKVYGARSLYDVRRS